MGGEIFAIIGVGVALAALMLTMFQIVFRRLDAMDKRLSDIEQRQSGIEQRQAHLEGLLEGIRELLSRVPIQ
ncbi:MAG: hypothetical protein OXI16_04250 [Chloroflexota bacterium]|nr:hypothetical protein [Chloroflexota bacterium]